jgi:hypothetical protein
MIIFYSGNSVFFRSNIHIKVPNRYNQLDFILQTGPHEST